MITRQKLFDRLPLLAKLEVIFEKIQKEKKLYSKQAIAKLVNGNVDSVRHLLAAFLTNKWNIDRIIIDSKMFYGNKKLINKIREMLVE